MFPFSEFRPSRLCSLCAFTFEAATCVVNHQQNQKRGDTEMTRIENANRTSRGRNQRRCRKLSWSAAVLLAVSLQSVASAQTRLSINPQPDGSSLRVEMQNNTRSPVTVTISGKPRFRTVTQQYTVSVPKGDGNFRKEFRTRQVQMAVGGGVSTVTVPAAVSVQRTVSGGVIVNGENPGTATSQPAPGSTLSVDVNNKTFETTLSLSLIHI